MAEQPSGTASESSAGDSDQDFDPSAEMMVNDYDDERTMEEEEELERDDDDDDTGGELDDLKNEAEVPLEELLALYGYGAPPAAAAPSTTTPPSSTSSASNVATTTSNVGALGVEGNADLLPSSAASVDPSQLVHGTDVSTAARRPFNVHSSHDNVPNPSDIHGFPDYGLLTPTLTSTHALFDRLSDDGYDEEDDDDADYASDEDEEDHEESDWRRQIQIGDEYQATIPDGLSSYDGAPPPYENEDHLLWDPYELSDLQVEEFLRKVQKEKPVEIESKPKLSLSTTSPSSTSVQGSGDALGLPSPHPPPLLPVGSHVRDDEQALYLLLQSGLNVEEALRRLKNGDKSWQNDALWQQPSLWSEEETLNFEEGLRIYGKDFFLIQQNKVRTRSVGELVQFYYIWKKTERHDLFAQKCRLEKKKYALHPGTTDYMDRFLDEQENMATTTTLTAFLTSSSSSNAPSYLVGSSSTPSGSNILSSSSSTANYLSTGASATPHLAAGHHHGSHMTLNPHPHHHLQHYHMYGSGGNFSNNSNKQNQGFVNGSLYRQPTGPGWPTSKQSQQHHSSEVSSTTYSSQSLPSAHPGASLITSTQNNRITSSLATSSEQSTVNNLNNNDNSNSVDSPHQEPDDSSPSKQLHPDLQHSILSSTTSLVGEKTTSSSIEPTANDLPVSSDLTVTKQRHSPGPSIDTSNEAGEASSLSSTKSITTTVTLSTTADSPSVPSTTS